jgi:arylsulfatase A
MKSKLNRRGFLKMIGVSAAAVAAGPSLGAPAKATGATKPNFIVIYADDQGYGDLSCYGATKFKTPHIDKMAEEGMKFTDFYVTAPVCSPTRSSLVTGCYPRRVGMHRHVLFPNSTRGLNHKEITIAELLKKQGYATACVGKWHLGHQKEFLPTSQGFDYYYGIPFSNDMWLPANMTYADDAKLPDNFTDDQRKKGERKRSTVPLMRNEEVIEYPANQPELTERYTREVIKFITANKGGPFFVYLPHTMPHYPLHVSKKFKGKSGAGLFGDVIACIDWGVGEILKALKSLGIDKNTLVIYTSDNGPAAGSAGPLRGRKGTTWEGGMREPCVMRWPGKIPPKSTCSELATIMDLLPTLTKLAGGEAPKDRVIDGKDIWPLMSGKSGAKSPYEAFFYHTSRGQLAAVRCGKWKLHITPPRTRRRKNQPKPKPVTGVQLFDLSADINEAKNVATDNPDVVKKLTGLLKTFDEEIKANLRPPGKA